MDDMDELGELLAPILQDPETMEKLRRQAEQLGLGDMLGSAPQGDSPKTSGNARHNDPEERNHAQEHRAGCGADDMAAMLTRLMPLISGLGAEDDSTRLLGALRPFLSEKRGRRLDEAGKLLSVMRVIRLLPKIDQ